MNGDRAPSVECLRVDQRADRALGVGEAEEGDDACGDGLQRQEAAGDERVGADVEHRGAGGQQHHDRTGGGPVEVGDRG